MSQRFCDWSNWPDPDARAKDVVDFETKIADASWTKAQQRDPIATYNPMTVDELEKFAPGFAWKRFLAEAKMEKLSRVIVGGEKRLSKADRDLREGAGRNDSRLARISSR